MINKYKKVFKNKNHYKINYKLINGQIFRNN